MSPVDRSPPPGGKPLGTLYNSAGSNAQTKDNTIVVVVVALVVDKLLLSAGKLLLSAGKLLLSAGKLLLSAGKLLLSAGKLLLGVLIFWGPYFLEVFSLLQELGATYRRKTYIFRIREAKRLF